ncbi:MAG: 50S ribosomal protein L25, partial [Cytophagia bacterium]|nr:50S ribosomal protein L25 [Cytophagia bacterium]
MKSINLSGSLRENVGKSDSNLLRAEGKIPCVLYGNAASQSHFWAHAYDLKSVLF